MIKAVMRGHKGTLVYLGITARNVEALKQDHPIVVHGAEIGLAPDLTIFIAYGETEETIAKAFRDANLIGPDTDVQDHRGEKKQ